MIQKTLRDFFTADQIQEILKLPTCGCEQGISAHRHYGQDNLIAEGLIQDYLHGPVRNYFTGKLQKKSEENHERN